MSGMVMAMVIGPVLAFSCAVSAAEEGAQVAAAGQSPEVWMCHSNIAALVAEDAQWDSVKQHLDVLQIYIVEARKASPDTLARLANVLKDNGIRLSVECGGTLDYGPIDETNGEWSAWEEMAAFDKLIQAGCKISYLDLDHPVRRVMDPVPPRKGFETVEQAVDQLIIYMQKVHAAYPDIEFFEISNFPNWGYRGGISYHAGGKNRQEWGEYSQVIETIIRKTREAKLPFRGVTVDNPYDYAIGVRPSFSLKDPTQMNWMRRIRDLEEYVEGQGLDFTLIVNSERGGETSDEAFYKDTLAFVAAYRAAGGSPKRYMVQSWYKHPEAVVPETEPFTMTNLVKEVIMRVKRGVD